MNDEEKAQSRNRSESSRLSGRKRATSSMMIEQETCTERIARHSIQNRLWRYFWKRLAAYDIMYAHHLVSKWHMETEVDCLGIMTFAGFMASRA